MPQSLEAGLAKSWGVFTDQLEPEILTRLQHALDASTVAADFDRLLATSNFFRDQFIRHRDWAVGELEAGRLFQCCDLDAEAWKVALKQLVLDNSSEDAVMSALRIFRNRQMLSIVACELSGRAALSETFQALTRLADITIQFSVDWATAKLSRRFGLPVGEWSGEAQELVVLGMGKLGGGELNLSSDIDLIYAYPEAGETQGGKRTLSNQEFFIRVGQLVIKLLDAKTVDGFVFRVDMRLRPFGSSGPLVVNYNALEVYYQQHGRDWERYAMIKARAITGSVENKKPFEELKRAFVYRRYTDYGALHALREMREMIAAETLRSNLQTNIKRGYGGIREIEFIVQCKQLIHGGRHPELQVRPLELAYQCLAELDFISVEDRQGLIDAYRFLRRLENILQGLCDTQTQELPGDPISQAQVALLMGYSDWAAMITSCEAVRQRVSEYFQSLVTLPGDPSSEIAASVGVQYADLCPEALAALGYRDASATWAAVETFMSGGRVQAAQSESRHRLEAFLPQLISVSAKTDNADLAVTRTLPFVSAVLRRSAYLVMMTEHPQALEQLVSLNVASPWIARKLAQRPELVEELLHEDRLYRAPNRSEMGALVQDQLLRVPEDDLEQQMHAMAGIKDAVVLRVAASELNGSLPVMVASDNLTFLAEVMVTQAIQVARAELVTRHGEPQGDEAGFAVMGYGKLGGIELGYGSDLDLVFVYDGGRGTTSGPKIIENTRFFTRLAQRVVHVLSTNVAQGRLYEVDLRLRPDGGSGLPCVTFGSFRKYQHESAWTWEHQALVRARPVAGSAELCHQLEALRLEILRKVRPDHELRDAVVTMRLRMFEGAESRLEAGPDEFDIKRDPGGIVDIEFVVQFLVLQHAATHPDLAQATDVVNLLNALADHDLLSAQDADTLRAAYLVYRAEVHRAVLEDVDLVGKRSKFMQQLVAVTQIRDGVLPGLPALEIDVANG
ncbi:bifunctional [glutamate--ammonia ligase]-adenylyl-L-tyrosine phosphorylase/[glutamate--ammonia-ligase] adenylyltransferase [Luminiphilus sp. nBUS_16]|uniref:bifunctional [glutamate--ammonia ligase]-adenylyl-L-tyrosine phosphorylase/[glutamate--ammonia-ligase] adenylyltransferase n=1 Tax=Luminiphilus sp. nBUS_16 TaxID=3395315 RepID=UPI003EBE285F